MPVPSFAWTQLGAFVSVIANVSDHHLDRFATAGGKWIAPLIYNDVNAIANVGQLDAFQARCEQRNIRVGCWANAFGEDAYQLIGGFRPIVDQHALAPVIVDAEAAYQGNTRMSFLILAMREAWPKGTKNMGVSTNAMNDSQVYNGRTAGYPPSASAKSFRDLNVQVLPQWYSSPNYWGPYHQADTNMEWVHLHGMEDNWLDLGYTDKRAVSKSMIHGTLEVTGLENANLKDSLDRCMTARAKYGLGQGISIYLLENTPDSDFVLLGQYRGKLYL